MKITKTYTIAANSYAEVDIKADFIEAGVARLSIINENGEEGGGSTPYELPVATSETLGGVKIGDNLSIDENGVLSAQAGGASLDVIAEEFDANKGYNVGDYCIYEGKLLKCKAEVEAFKWKPLPIVWANALDSEWIEHYTSPETVFMAVYSGGVVLASKTGDTDYEYYREKRTSHSTVGPWTTSLSTDYTGTVYSGKYMNTGYTVAESDVELLPYDSLQDALTDFFDVARGFDAEKWEEVNVTDELKPLKVYSTEEHIVGTWIDGSTIYEKIIDISPVTTGNSSVEISGADKILFYDGYFLRIINDNICIKKFSYYYSTTEKLDMDTVAGTIYYGIGTAYASSITNAHVYIKAQYTKGV